MALASKTTRSSRPMTEYKHWDNNFKASGSSQRSWIFSHLNCKSTTNQLLVQRKPRIPRAVPLKSATRSRRTSKKQHKQSHTRRASAGKKWLLLTSYGRRAPWVVIAPLLLAWLQKVRTWQRDSIIVHQPSTWRATPNSSRNQTFNQLLKVPQMEWQSDRPRLPSRKRRCKVSSMNLNFKTALSARRTLVLAVFQMPNSIRITMSTIPPTIILSWVAEPPLIYLISRAWAVANNPFIRQ